MDRKAAALTSEHCLLLFLLRVEDILRINSEFLSDSHGAHSDRQS
jgi:hypothetical protein